MSKIKAKIGWWKSRITYDWRPWKTSQLIRFYKGFIQKGDLCFDVGAHTGNRTSAWEKIGARVVVIEPQPFFAKHLKTRFKNDKIIIEEVGIGAEKGELSMKVSNLYPTISTFSKQWESTVNKVLDKEVYDEVIQVKMTTLTDLIEKHGLPNFCKIDVEGYELEVLKGLSQEVANISFEFYTDHLDQVEKCLDRLNKLGKYEFNWSKGEQLKLRSESWLKSSEVLKVLNMEKGKISFSGDIYARIIK